MKDEVLDEKSRYYDAGGIETLDIIRAKLTPEQYKGFLLGNILKYGCRANHKGCFERDLEKVGYYQAFLAEFMALQSNAQGEAICEAISMAMKTGAKPFRVGPILPPPGSMATPEKEKAPILYSGTFDYDNPIDPED